MLLKINFIEFCNAKQKIIVANLVHVIMFDIFSGDHGAMQQSKEVGAPDGQSVPVLWPQIRLP